MEFYYKDKEFKLYDSGIGRDFDKSKNKDDLKIFPKNPDWVLTDLLPGRDNLSNCYILDRNWK